MSTIIPRYAFWNPGTWSIPALYWDAFSDEQRIHAICKQLGKVIAYADYLGINVDDIAKRLKAIEDGQLDQFIVDAIEQWFEDNQPAIVTAIQSLSDALPIADFDDVNTVKSYIDTNIGTVSDVLPIADFDDVNTVKNYIDTNIDTVSDVLPLADFDGVNTVKNYIDANIQDATWNYETSYNERFIGGSFSNEELLFEFTFADDSISQSMVYHEGYFYVSHHVNDSSPMQVSKIAPDGTVLNTIYLPAGIHGNSMDYCERIDKLVLADTATTSCYCIDLALTSYYAVSNPTSLSNVAFDRENPDYIACRAAGGVQYAAGLIQNYSSDWYANIFWYLNGSVTSNGTGQDCFYRDHKIYQLNYTNNPRQSSGIDVINRLGAVTLHMKLAADSALCNLQYGKGEVEGIDYYGPGDIPERGGQGEKYAILVSHSDKRQSMWIIDSGAQVPIIASVYKVQARYAATFRDGVLNQKVGNITFNREYLVPFYANDGRRCASMPIQWKVSGIIGTAWPSEAYTVVDASAINKTADCIIHAMYHVENGLIRLDSIYLRDLIANTTYSATGLKNLNSTQFETNVTAISTQIYNHFGQEKAAFGLLSAGMFPSFANGNASWKFTQ